MLTVSAISYRILYIVSSSWFIYCGYFFYRDIDTTLFLPSGPNSSMMKNDENRIIICCQIVGENMMWRYPFKTTSFLCDPFRAAISKDEER